MCKALKLGRPISGLLKARQGQMSNLKDLPKPTVDSRGVFDHPWEWTKEPGYLDILRFVIQQKHARSPWLLGNENPQTEDWQKAFPFNKADFAALHNPPGGAVQALWIGHASLLIQMGGVTFLVDPVFLQRCSPSQWFGGAKRLVQPPLQLDDAELPDIDFVLISHDHYDHLEYASVKALHKRFASKIHWYVPLKLGDWFKSSGIAADNVHEMNWWDEVVHAGTNIRVAYTPAQHSSQRSPFRPRRSTLWGGFVVKTDSLSFYTTGDTGYCPIFPLIGEKYGPFDLAAIPVGSYYYKGLFGTLHCNPEEAVQIHQEVKARRSIGIHCCTFQLASMEAMDEPPKRLRAAIEQAGLKPDEFVVLQHGTQIVTANGQDYGSRLLL